MFYNLRNSDLLYGIQGFSETTPGLTSHVKEYDVTGMGETFGMIVHDYAGNSKSYTVKAVSYTHLDVYKRQQLLRRVRR